MTLRDFESTCEKFRVVLTNEELRRIKDLFCEETESGREETVLSPKSMEKKAVLNFKKMSLYLDLHKESLNFIT